MIGNSVGAKESDTHNVLQYGKLSPQFAERGGQALVAELASPKHGTWSWGAIRITDAYGLDEGGSSPKKIVHFCVPQKYEGDVTYLVSFTLSQVDT